MHYPRQPLHALSGNETFDLVLDHPWHHVFLSQGDAAQNHRRHGHNRACEQRPHEQPAPREKPDDLIHRSRRFGNYPGGNHKFG